ncbi:HU family DNA-binding protein [Marinilabilia salmonicolor]|jgi:cell division septation protein DedD|uniref:DNA-binding protein n=1 Tax=Marinilabilia salmonicolor TaxID=989 RepID=A0A2T0XQT5_9BACT|nr:HU family DNA-binding protein [Marinilabilia salmonicolor]PRZ01318.1 DNA-binding protein [Marinilabilia salmonicolor]RCW39283.1 DNA-binding protein [Marinilabilia salmonicolor]
MEQYLLELIKSNNRVIVPNFGAFIVSRDSGTTVLFNNFLSFNDGLLINHVSTKKGIETTEATDMVSDFVDKIKKELDEQGEYTIDKLGTFTKDQNGILRFTQDPHLAELLPEEKTEKNLKEGGPDSQLLDIDSNAPEEPVDEKTIKEETPKDKKSGEVKSDGKLLNLDEKKGATDKKQPVKPEKTGGQKKQADGGASGGKTTVVHKEKRSGLPPWLIALLILIPIVLFVLYLIFWTGEDKKKETKVVKKEVVDTNAAQRKADSIAMVKARQEEQLRKEEEARKKAEAEKTKGPRHHIIVGSFKEEANAEKLVKRLKENGFEQASLLSHNNMVLVSAVSFESVLKAREAQEKVLQEQRLENWILTKK